ncbi:hypothetical protein Bpfe_005598, partial [Biomphalaria pfeifferi]
LLTILKNMAVNSLFPSPYTPCHKQSVSLNVTEVYCQVNIEQVTAEVYCQVNIE